MNDKAQGFHNIDQVSRNRRMDLAAQRLYWQPNALFDS